MKTERIGPETTPRLEREAAAWQRHGRRPAAIETPGPGRESVWDYPRPPALERVHAEVLVEHGGAVVARTRAALRVCETASPPTYYLPLADVRRELLRDAGGGSVCEWKGAAHYFDVCVGDRIARQAAWSYPKPTPEYAALADHVAFYASRLDRCAIDGEPVRPQPGGFYAGWITPELCGPFKGEPGSSGW